MSENNSDAALYALVDYLVPADVFELSEMAMVSHESAALDPNIDDFDYFSMNDSSYAHSTSSSVTGLSTSRQPGHRDGIHPTRKRNRNQQEHSRSRKIAREIDTLGNLLAEKGIGARSSKHSILSKVASYIRRMKDENARLEQKIQSTSRGGCGITKSQLTADIPFLNHSSTATRDSGPSTLHVYSYGEGGFSASQSTRCKERSVDYRTVFDCAPVPWAIADLVGRIIESNHRFEDLSGYRKEELMSFTMFNLISNGELYETFSAVGALLASPNSGISSPPVIIRRAKLNPKKERLMAGYPYSFAQYQTPIHNGILPPFQQAPTPSVTSGSTASTMRTGSVDIAISLVLNEALQPMYFHVRLVPAKRRVSTLPISFAPTSLSLHPAVAVTKVERIEVHRSLHNLQAQPQQLQQQQQQLVEVVPSAGVAGMLKIHTRR